MTRLTDTGVRRARVRGQLLSGRVPAGRSVEDVVGRLVGVQAQDATAATLAIRARSRGLVAADVDRAREERRVVLTWSLRGTRHLHRADDVRWLVARVGPTFLRPSKRAEQLGIAGAAGDRAVEALVDALAAEGPLTRPQVKERLAPHGVDPSGQAAIHVIARAALEGRLCVLPGERYVLLDDWLGPPTGAAAGEVGPGGRAGPALPGRLRPGDARRLRRLVGTRTARRPPGVVSHRGRRGRGGAVGVAAGGRGRPGRGRRPPAPPQPFSWAPSTPSCWPTPTAASTYLGSMPAWSTPAAGW